MFQSLRYVVSRSPHLGLPSSLRFAACVLPMLSLAPLLFTFPAFAQSPSGSSYGPPTYGGSGTYDPGGGPPTGPPVRSFSTSGGVSGFGGQAAAGGNTTEYAKGGITTSFNWTGTDPAPQSVIVTQTCVATWLSAYCTPAVIGSCDNGLNGLQLTTGPTELNNGPGTSEGYDATGTCGEDSSGNAVPVYSVVTGAATLNLPTLNVNSSITGSTTAGPLIASVSYSAAVSPVTITLSGVKVDTDGSLKLLTGQQVEASLNLNGGPGNLSNFDWTVEGDGVYGAYLPSESSAQIQPIDTGESSVFFYDKTGGDKISVSCTATITFPDGTTSSVSATAPVINVLKPTVTRCDINNIPGVNYSPNNFSDDGGEPWYGAREIWAPIVITVPDPFGNITGSAGIAQMIRDTTFQDTRATSGEPAYVPQMEIAPYGTYNTWVPVMGGLDCGFLYPFTDNYNSDANGNGTVSPSNSTAWNAPGTGAAEDNPSVPCAPNLVAGDTGTTDWNASGGQDDFYTWIMFSPDGSSWVPLSKFSWTFVGDANKTGSMWQGGSGPSSSGATATDEFPEWDTVVPFSGTGHLRYGPAQ